MPTSVTMPLMASRVTDYVRTTIDRTQGRSMVMSAGGVAASEHPLASQAGASILARGGHAVDAAIAVNAAMGVVAPMMNGIGGDLFAIVYDAASGELHGINGSGCAPAALTIDRLRKSGVTTMPQTGIHSVTIPGAVAAWSKLSERFGVLPLGDVLAPAIQIAEEGFPVPEITAAEWAGSATLLQATEESARVYLPGGWAPRVGQMFRNPDLAASYRALGVRGTRRLLSRRHRPAHRQLLGSPQRRALCRRPGGVRRGVGHPALDDISRLDGLRAAAQRAGHRRTDDAQPDRARADRIVRAQFGRGTAHAHRGEEAGLRRHGAARLRPRVPYGPGRRDAVEGLRRAARAADRSGARQPGGRTRHAADPRRRHHLPERRRSGGQHGVAHPEQLRQLRVGAGAGWCWIRAAEPRRTLHDGSDTRQRPGAAQASAPHDHSWLHDRRPSGTPPRRSGRHVRVAFGDHGRLEPIAGPRRSSSRTSSITG